jgi:broad specificity phosphatase PhoE
VRVVLIRHGQPHIALSPRTGHAGFSGYIGDYEAAGLAPTSFPPQELADLGRELTHIFTSGRARSHQSAATLAPHAELVTDEIFVEAPLASPRIPLLQMRVPKWAVISRILWHLGFHPGIENPRQARRRAARAAEMLADAAAKRGTATLVAHGYFNWMIGRELIRRGFSRTGSHQARYWNTVIYERKDDRDKG